jgi:hypothetical protein
VSFEYLRLSITFPITPHMIKITGVCSQYSASRMSAFSRSQCTLKRWRSGAWVQSESAFRLDRPGPEQSMVALSLVRLVTQCPQQPPTPCVLVFFEGRSESFIASGLTASNFKLAHCIALASGPVSTLLRLPWCYQGR